MAGLNATHLFEGSNGKRAWPASAESFWTTLFSLFALHLGTGTVSQESLTIWHCTDGPNYPRLIGWLLERDVSFDFLILQSAGCCNALAQQARAFQREAWAAHFGVLLWEEVLREMKGAHFCFPGVPINAWQKYSAALDSDCARDLSLSTGAT